jgi:hypothetical protein
MMGPGGSIGPGALPEAHGRARRPHLRRDRISDPRGELRPAERRQVAVAGWHGGIFGEMPPLKSMLAKMSP